METRFSLRYFVNGCRYYLDAVSTHGFPRFVKADDGTEHSTVEPIHIGLRIISADVDLALNSFSIITSPQNQHREVY